MKPYWLQGVNQHTAFTATDLVHLLLSGSVEERPDALFIANASLVEASTLGVKQAGLDAPRDLTVVAGNVFPGLQCRRSDD